ncbi:TIGR03936 family radical SAM-associated protein [Aminipila sp.]|uniref:TIGR03936 family radical SAM-associated protein n=1 Tax=Aminipila sp. TaxID=2060095 RepID=UPI002898F944|nr:TIGR03936 family radical SAM-associated protein [Aminipila sp.]
MAKYVLKFSKENYFKYTSHLDLLRFFKRSFKRAGIKLNYSQGFNPHPKMGFAQPLSLGYSSIYELLEFEVSEKMSADDVMNRLKMIMPEGLKILGCVEYGEEGRSLAALTVAAEYIVDLPFGLKAFSGKDCQEACCDFLSQEHIFVKKKQKKSKELVEVDIKNKIKEITFASAGERTIVHTVLDAGSESNLSPELLIEAITAFFKQDVPRYDIEVMRKKIIFSNNFTI